MIAEKLGSAIGNEHSVDAWGINRRQSGDQTLFRTLLVDSGFKKNTHLIAAQHVRLHLLPVVVFCPGLRRSYVCGVGDQDGLFLTSGSSFVSQMVAKITCDMLLY